MNTETIAQVVSKYPTTSPIFRGLIQLIPCGIGSAIDVAVVTKIENIHKYRLIELADEIEKCNVQLTRELIESEEYLYCCYSIVKAVLNTPQKEKIRYFARLFTSSINSPEITIDEYKECLSILDEISYRELGILVVLSRYEKEYFHQVGEDSSERSSLFWDQFSDEVCSKFSIPMEELSSILTRLNRTGLYVTATGYSSIAEASLKHMGRVGELTPLYKKFEKLIRPVDGEFK